MSPERVEVRPFETEEDYRRMIAYFTGGSDEFLRGMGVDPARVPAPEAWLAAALADHVRPDGEKQRLYLGWHVDGELIGHSSASHIEVGESAHVHLHLWRPDLRREGLGTELFARSVDLYLERLRLKRVICEPNAHNPGPNRTLARLGFELLHTRRCVPTELALEQDVSHWEIPREVWRERRGAL